MNNRMLKLIVLGLALLPFLAKGMENPLQGRVQYEISFNNRTGEQSLNLQAIDANGIQLFKEQVNLDQWSPFVLLQVNQLPITINISSGNGIISGGTQLTQQKIHDELQKAGVTIPYNFSGKVVVTIFIYQRAVSYHGKLIPTQINLGEPQRALPVFQSAAQIVPAAAQVSLPRGEYNITIFGANKKPARVQLSAFNKQTGQYSASRQQLLENNGVIKQNFSANDFPILFRVFEGTSGSTLVFEDDLDLPALNLKDFSYTVSGTSGKFEVSYYPQVSHGKEAQALRQRVHAREAAVAQPSYVPSAYQTLQAPAASVVPREQQTRAGNFMIEFRHESRKPLKIELFTSDGKRIIEKILQPNESFNLPNVTAQEFPLELTYIDEQGRSIEPEKIDIPGFRQMSIMTYDGWLFINIQPM